MFISITETDDKNIYAFISYILKSCGPSCLKVVDKEIGGTTAMEFHCSGSCPEWAALVAKWESFVRKQPF